MRLPPIDRPPNLMLRMARRMSLKQFGKVIAPLRTIYPRKPRLLPIAAMIQRTMENGLSLDPGLRLLVQVQASRANGCTFCQDLALAQAVRARLGGERFSALEDFRTSGVFTDRERAALAFTDEAVRDRQVRDETFAAARAHFSETEMVELAWVAAAETYFNVQAHASGVESDDLLALATASTGKG